MPDDDLRPTHGPPPDSRPTNTPPAWWPQLERQDLPAGGAPRGRRRVHRGGPDQPRRRRWSAILVNLTALAVAALLVVVAVVLTAPRATTAVLLACVALGLLALLGVQIARRVGRHW
jgi:VIT1/CCC1 family predicted Fe2+/Mn2+ transporter